MEKTEVIFRFWKKEIIALFPYDIDNNGLCGSYMHVGQHSPSGYEHIIRHSRPATEPEYRELYAELESIGYKLEVVHKRMYSRFVEAYKKQIAYERSIA